MSIDRGLWKESLNKSYAPRWPCPSCTGGVLQLKHETLHYEATAESRRSHNEDYSGIWDVKYSFSALLKCSQCFERISCCGLGGYKPVDSVDEDGNNYTDDELYFDPRYFSVPMELFCPPTTCPDTVEEQIRKSFSVFFCDLSAAANHVRQCIEKILFHADIQPLNADGGFLSLETRIKSFAKVDHENAERAHALRWIGNFGSHPEKLNKEDLFDAYDILEVLLEDLYVGHHRSVRQIVEQINKARGPIR